jgi:hypothetical protein
MTHVKIDKQGISKRFLSYFHSLDKSVGERALGRDQTISGKLQSTVGKAVHRAKTADEEKGYLKTVHDVSFFFLPLLENEMNYSFLFLKKTVLSESNLVSSRPESSGVLYRKFQASTRYP